VMTDKRSNGKNAIVYAKAVEKTVQSTLVKWPLMEPLVRQDLKPSKARMGKKGP